MHPNEPTNIHQFDASLQLPIDAMAPGQPAQVNAAADLVRSKVQQAYKAEPSAAEEALDVAELGGGLQRSRHQDYIYGLTTSGKSLAEIQVGWHEYYAGLTDVEKHQVWQEFYSAHAQASRYAAANPAMSPHQVETAAMPIIKSRPKPGTRPVAETVADIRARLTSKASGKSKLKPVQHFQSLLFGLGVGSVVMLIFLFSFFNERFIAPFIQPSRTITSTPIISDNAAISPNPEIIIPKINVQIPVVYGVNTINETSIENALENGVVHYADTALPGQNGNLVIVGHSSNNIFNKGHYKFAFVLLSRIDKGDTFYLERDGKRYTYQVYEKKIVRPTDVSVLAPADKPAVATLITCDPPGTSTNRLVVVGQQISPDPLANTPSTADNSLATKSAIIPGNSPSLWSRFISLF